ncbi:MAG TPA: DUF1232 domain-containing protein [Thermoanaerobaculia bacterium]|nr:DUF1232 domain-containing protein [Thermoanaerobaculia bacterium]
MDDTPRTDDVTDEELVTDLAAESGAISETRALRFYDRVRTAIHEYVERKGGGALGKTAEFLLLVPDVFILLWRLFTDGRVGGKDKVLLGSAIAYYIFPFDIIPEAIVGPIGYLDDLVFGVYVLNKVLKDTDPSILRQHWSGSSDVLDSIQRVLNAADSLVGKEFLGRIKKMLK